MDTGSDFNADSGESKATVHITWVWPRWNIADPCNGRKRSTSQLIRRNSVNFRPSHLPRKRKENWGPVQVNSYRRKFWMLTGRLPQKLDFGRIQPTQCLGDVGCSATEMGPRHCNWVNWGGASKFLNGNAKQCCLALTITDTLHGHVWSALVVLWRF